MLTQTQKETFEKLKEGKLNAKQRSDFFYRMSKILKQELENLEDLSFLLDELPESYMEKINLREASIHSMNLTEKLIKKTVPAFIYHTIDNNWAAVRYFNVDLGSAIPGLEQNPEKIKITYVPTKEDKEYFNKVRNYLVHLSDRIADKGQTFIMDTNVFNEYLLKLQTENKSPLKVQKEQIKEPTETDKTEHAKAWARLLTSEYNLPESEVAKVEEMYSQMLAEIEEKSKDIIEEKS